jgi:antitoxin VapB
MNIDDPTVQALAEEIASRTGESITEVIRIALQQRRASLPLRRASEEEIQVLLNRIHSLPKIGPDIPHGELLYGEDGLPR